MFERETSTIPDPDSQSEPSAVPFVLSDDVQRQMGTVRADGADLSGCFRQSDLRLIYLNDAASARLDPKRQLASVRLSLPDFIGVASSQKFQSQILPQVSVLGRWSGECELRDVWGGEFPVTVVFVAQPGEKGSPSLILFHAQERAPSKTGTVRFSDRQLLFAMLEHAHDSVYFKDAASRYLRLSPLHLRRLGASEPTAVIGRTDFDFLATERAGQAYCQDQDVIRSGKPLLEQEVEVTEPDGTKTWLSITKIPLYDSAGTPIGLFGRERDISAQKQAESERHEMETQLQLASKMESIGRLAAGVAHEINTPTQFITDNMHFLRGTYTQLAAVVQAAQALRTAAAGHPDCAAAAEQLVKAEAAAELAYIEAEVPRCIEQSLDGLARVARIVCSLKELAHPNSPNLTPVDLNHIIETSVTVSRHEWKYVAELTTELDPNLPKVPCVVDEFNQVILNLVINAAHAIADALKLRGEAQGRIVVRTRLDGDRALVEVEDSGTGIPEEIRERIFEPFFTTKPVGKGTGQGLAIVRSVIEKHHHGRIEVRSQVGKGTTFVLHLPLQQAPAAAAPVSPAIAP